MGDRIVMPILVLLGIAIAAAVARGGEPKDMYAWPCPRDTLYCHQKIISIEPGKTGEMLMWQGNDFVWVPSCATINDQGLVTSVWPVKKGELCKPATKP